MNKNGEELTTQELMDLRVILVRFMADKEGHKKIPRLESRAPKLWDKVDHMYRINRKGTRTVVESFHLGLNIGANHLNNKRIDLSGNNKTSHTVL